MKVLNQLSMYQGRGNTTHHTTEELRIEAGYLDQLIAVELEQDHKVHRCDKSSFKIYHHHIQG